MMQALPSGPAPLALASAVAFAVAAVLLKRGLQHATPFAAVLVSVQFTAATVWTVAIATETLPLDRLTRLWPFLVAGLAARRDPARLPAS